MEKPKPAKLFFIFAGICVIALPFIIFSALSIGSQEVASQEISSPEMGSPQNLDFDHNGSVIFATYDDTTGAYMDGSSTSRTLNYYYSLRQYPGSPPYIVHDLNDEKGKPYECLSCHARGGFTQSMNRFAPVTPHPTQTYCQQCHVKPVTDKLFKETDWASVMPPRLGRSALPGSPPPIAHAIQMRENCIACHVGPGAVVVIRVEHPMRGNCRQCHLPTVTTDVFKRAPQPKQ
jgi:cytochrome c-type protein NapB